MKKRILALMMAGAMVVGALSGCGGNSDKNSDNSANDTAGPEEEDAGENEKEGEMRLSKAVRHRQ